MKSAISVLAWLAASVVVSEWLGYSLHRLLHSGRIGWLSRSHMKHHLVLYNPMASQRPSYIYHDATTDDIALGNVGLEWLLPGTLLLSLSLMLLQFLHVTLLHRLVFVAGSLGWSFLMFSYLHDRMHVAGFWMERNWLLKNWFLLARNAHDIHHWALNDRGLMDRNFGIAFFLFDRLLGTFATEWPAFNPYGYAAAMKRFGDMVGSRGRKFAGNDV